MPNPGLPRTWLSRLQSTEAGLAYLPSWPIKEANSVNLSSTPQGLKNKHRVLLLNESDVNEATRICMRLNIKETKWRQLDEFRNNMSSTMSNFPVRERIFYAALGLFVLWIEIVQCPVLWDSLNSMLLHTSEFKHLYVHNMCLLTTRRLLFLNFGVAATMARSMIVTQRWASAGNAGSGKLLRCGYQLQGQVCRQPSAH
ncbi:hypothetical protein ACQJBY_041216 [Aegilops geniculata]